MSETFPVKFEKLGLNGSRPRLAQPREDGFKVKQRLSSLKDCGNGRASSSKIKIVYIDPLNREEEAKVNSLSIEEIINDKFGSKSHDNSTSPNKRSLVKDTGVIAINEDSEDFPPSHRVQPLRLSNSRSRPSSNCSARSDRSNGIPSPKLKTQPINSSHHPSMAGNLSIMTPGARYTPPINEMPRSAKSAGRISPTKPLHRSGAGAGSSIKAGPLQGEPEYIKITSQLKIASNGTLQPASHSHYDYRPGSNTPQDGAYSPFGTDTDFIANKEEELYNRDDLPRPKAESDHDLSEFQDQIKIINDDNNNSMNNNEDHDASNLSDSPAPTTVAISIPTADELSDRDSLTNSPSRPGIGTDDDLTSFQRRERNMRNEQIDQLTNLLGNAVVDS